MFLKSHKWVYVPHYAHEIRREMRVRESKHTVMLWDKRDYDCETGKVKFDSLKTLNTSLWTDDMSDHSDYLNRLDWQAYVEELRENRDYKLTGKKKKYKPKNAQDYYINNEGEYVKIPKHVPKDDDFEKEVKVKEPLVQSYVKQNQEALRVFKEREKIKTEAEIFGEIAATNERNRLRMRDDIRNAANQLSGMASLKRAQEKRALEELERRNIALEKEREATLNMAREIRREYELKEQKRHLEWQIKQLEHEEMLRAKGFRISESTSIAKNYVGNVGSVMKNKCVRK